MKVLTKAQLNEGIALGKFDIRPTNRVFINNNEYILTVSVYEDKCTLEKVEQFKEKENTNE